MPGKWQVATYSKKMLQLNHTFQLIVEIMGYPLQEGGEFDICHKHHKQRLCKIVTTWVKFHFVDMF